MKSSFNNQFSAPKTVLERERFLRELNRTELLDRSFVAGFCYGVLFASICLLGILILTGGV
jgi:hypothetical protein